MKNYVSHSADCGDASAYENEERLTIGAILANCKFVNSAKLDNKTLSFYF